MTRLAATLGLSAVAAGLALAAVQLLPPRDGGAARAATGTPLAWADPPRSAPARPAPTPIPAPPPAIAAVAAEAPTEPTPAAPPAETRTARRPAAPSPAARPEPRVRQVGRLDRGRRLAARVRPGRVARVAPQRRDDRPAAPVRTASARMGGPLGDILHGLGLD
jgi:hypothetical protein